MVIKIGHRGAIGYAPENTLPSFEKAIQLGVDMIELDARLTMDSEVVVFHDDRLKRLTNNPGYVYHKILDELKRLKVQEGEIIPSLRESLLYINRRAKVNIELKGNGNLAKKVAEKIDDFIVEQDWDYKDFIFSSFSPQVLKKLNGLNPELRLGVIKRKFPLYALKLAQEVNAYSVHLDYRVINKKIVAKAHGLELNIYVWTVNDEKFIEGLKKSGVDGIFSDYPDKI